MAPLPFKDPVRIRKFPQAARIGRNRLMIYHLAKQAAWDLAKNVGVYTGLPEDRADGYLHLSTATQIQESARKHRAGEPDLVLLFIDDEDLNDDILVWEESRGGKLFPHLYAALPVSAVRDAIPLPLGQDGEHVFPQLID